MKILLFGDERGLPVLTEKVPHENIAGIVCASIRPQYIDMLAELAAQQKLPFLVQPKPADSAYPEFLKVVQEMKPELIWVYSYSMILRDDLLSIPVQGAINIHGAILPQYRGANPTQWAILNGEMETGVTLHVMTSGVDEGPIIDQQKIPLFFEDTWKDVFQRNDHSARMLIKKNLAAILQGSWKANPQNERDAGYCRRRTMADGLFSWEQPVYVIYNLVRALVKPIPGAFYIDKTGSPVIIDEYHTIQQIIKRKYGIEGKQEFAHAGIQFLAEAPETFCDTPLVSLLKYNVIALIAKDMESYDILGWCYFTNINWRNSSAEIEIGSCAAKSKSYTAIIEALCEFGLAEINLKRIEVRLPANNESVISIFEQNGFVTEGILRDSLYINKQRTDSRLMSRLNKKS